MEHPSQIPPPSVPDPERGRVAQRRHLEQLVDDSPTALTVDMSGLRSLSSTTVAVLLHLSRICRARGKELLLRNPSRAVATTLRRSGLQNLFEVTTVDPTGASGERTVSGRHLEHRRPAPTEDT